MNSWRLPTLSRLVSTFRNRENNGRIFRRHFSPLLTAVENGVAGVVSGRFKIAAHNRDVFCEGTIGAIAPITSPSERGTGVHSDMGIWSEMHREGLTGALSKRAAIAKYVVGWHTLKTMLAHDEPPGYLQAKQRSQPKLDVFLPLIRQMLEDDGKAARRW
jgi:hypothetical protein